MCTLPDGSGVETTYTPTHVYEDNYTPEQWTKRLETVAKADKDYVKAVSASTAKIQRDLDIYKITNKKVCKAAGGQWHYLALDVPCTPKEGK